MAQINPYIHFNGNAEEAFNFYKNAFGGDFDSVVHFNDSPSDPNHPIVESEANKIMHIALPIGKGNRLMGCDVPSFMGTINENENRSKIAIAAESKEEADSLYNSLSAGGNIEMPIGESPWGTYFAMFRDIYGIEWMIEYREKR